jgi:hypothetical protein
MTLLFLFPTRYPQSANVISSFDKYLCKRTNEYRKYFPSSHTLTSGLVGVAYDINKEPFREYSYINSSAGIATVTEIVWLNDVLNNPKYRELIDILIQYNQWADERKENITTEIQAAEYSLIESILTNNEVQFTQEDINKIANQKNVSYSEEQLINDIKSIMKQYIVSVEPGIKDKTKHNCIEYAEKQLFNKKNDDGIINKIIMEEGKEGRENEIKIGRISSSLDKKFFESGILLSHLKYKDVNEKPYFKFKSVKTDTYNPETYTITTKPVYETIDGCSYINNAFYIIEELDKNKEWNDMKKNIKKDIKPYIDKYNRIFERTKTQSFSTAQLYAIDINIDKAVKEMETLYEIQNEDTNIYDMMNEKQIEEVFEKIMNAIDSLKLFFSNESIRENRITGVSSIQIKIDKILKKSNEIKGLRLVNQYLFSENSKGIYLYYDKEKTSSNTELLNELSKDKYSYFVNTVKYIKENFEFLKSTNKSLNDAMVSYFNNIGDKFSTEVVDKAKQAINSNEIVDKCENNKMLNTGVTKKRNIKKNEPEFEINIYMEVVIGQMDYKNQQNVKCDYRDENLVAMFDKMTTNPNNFEVIKKTNAVNINAKNTTEQPNVKNIENKKNGGTRRNRKYLNYNKYTRKTRK